ncbi:MAG: ankyrin repeat domain-containing protein, partial [Planctomycetota bacterium]
DRDRRSFLDHLQWRPSEHFPEFRSQEAARLIQAGDLNGLGRLRAAGMDFNASGNTGVTLLLWAFLAENRDVYVQMLEWGANPDAKLLLPQEIEVIPGVRSLCDGDTVTFLTALVPGKSDWLVETIQHGGDPNVARPPLMDSAFSAVFRRPGVSGGNRFRVMEILIEKGADINYRNRFGDSALCNAYGTGEWDLAVRLIVLGARVDCYDLKDKQFVHLVALTEDLRRRNIADDPLKKQEWQDSPVRKDFERLVELLAERGFPLEEAIADVKRANESVNGIPYMTWRRMQREDKDACTESPAPQGAAPKGEAAKKPAPLKDR